ncbi:MAG: hypothetical protein L6R42_002268 [Xanthoria sp. 1 TBL-2021]|nr:MAG: hypothetical protein L6R42_002268 [Xanthoria sp. 1 TBL-2021]
MASSSCPIDEYNGVFRWVLDVQSEWPCSDNIKSGREAALYWAQENDNRRALSFLTAEEHEKVLRFYHIRDVKLSLGSQLLKRCAVVQSCRVPWSESHISKHENHKPCYVPKNGSGKHLEFNVSHHGSLVALAGCTDRDIQIGVDVVQVDTVKDLPRVRQEGWSSWVRTYEAVFSDREVQDIITWEPSQFIDGDDLLRAKLRHFYAHWCLKEAYVKMTGDALMAPWLQDMEFRNVQTPRAASDLSAMDSTKDWGEAIPDVEVWRDGKQVTGVKLELQAFRNDYMIGIASSRLDVPFSPYKLLDLQQDVYSATEAS